MKRIVFIFLTIHFLSISQKESDTTIRHSSNHFVSTNIFGVGGQISLGYDYSFYLNNYTEIGAGISFGTTFSKKPHTRFSAISRLNLSFGKKWGWLEIGGEYNSLMNFYSIFQEEKYFNCPFNCQQKVINVIGPYIGPKFKIGPKKRHQIVLNYYAWFELYKGSSVFYGHFFGLRYRFKLK